MKPRYKEGIVVSKKMEKTAVVVVERVVSHPLYKKVITKYKRYHVHDPENQSKLGDKVLISESRPLSTRKRFRLVKIIGAGRPPGLTLPAKAKKGEESDQRSEQIAGS